MHRVFYRFFGSRGTWLGFLQILAGVFVGAVVGSWLFILLVAENKEAVLPPLLQGDTSILSLLVCGLLPVLLAGLLCCLGFAKVARIFIPGFAAALMSFSSLALFASGGYRSLLCGVMLFSGRTASLFWLFLFLLQEHSSGVRRFGKELIMSALLTVLTLLFFGWLTGPSLEAISIFSFK